MERKVSLMNHRKLNDYLIFLICGALLLCALLAGIIANLPENTTQPIAISVIVPDSGNARWANFKSGLRAAAREYSVDLSIVKTDAFTGSQQEQDVIHQEISQGAKGIITQLASSTGAKSFVEETAKAVPIVLCDSVVSVNQDNVSVLSMENEKAGSTLAIQASRMRKGSSFTVGILAGRSNTARASQRVLGVMNALGENRGVIAWLLYSDDTSIEKLQSLQSQTPVDMIIALDNDALETAVDYCQLAIENAPALFGIGVSDKCIYYTDVGTISKLIVEDEYAMGYQAIEQLAGRLQHHSSMQSVTIDFKVITKDNMFTAQNQELLFPLK